MTALLIAGVVAAGTVQRLAMPAPSLGQEKRDVRVYLPPSYFRPEAADRRYPVITLLHGWPGSEGNWLGQGHAAETADSLIASGRIPEVILVFPDGGRGLFGRSAYLNSYDGFRMEDFVVRDLVAWTDSTFRTRRDRQDRAIMGLSDGGSGAVNMAFKHPDLYSACGSSSGQFRLERDLGMGGVVGPMPKAQQLLDENSPALYTSKVTERLRDLTIYLDCGDADGMVGDNRHFHMLLLQLGVPHTYAEYPGSHGWSYWRRHLAGALVALTAHMGSGAGPARAHEP